VTPCARHPTLPSVGQCLECGILVCARCRFSLLDLPDLSSYCPACFRRKTKSGADFLDVVTRPQRPKSAVAPLAEEQAARWDRARRYLVMGDLFHIKAGEALLLDTRQRTYVLKGVKPDDIASLLRTTVGVEGTFGAVVALPRFPGYRRQCLRSIHARLVEAAVPGALLVVEECAAELTTVEDRLKEDPQNVKLLTRLGYTCFKAARTGLMARRALLQRGATALQQALARNPDSALAWHNLALIRAEEARFGEVADLCKKALALHPRFLSALFGLHSAYVQQGDVEAARDTLRRLVEVTGRGTGAMRQRLPLAESRRLGSRVTSGIAWSPQSLERKYGAHGRRDVEAALRDLAEAQQAAGLMSSLLAVEGSSTLEIKKELDERAAQARRDGDPLEYLLLIGGPEQIPFGSVTDPTDSTMRLESDNIYGSEAPFGADSAAHLLPTRRLGRIPDEGGAREPRFLLNQIGNAAVFHRDPAPCADRVFVYCAQAWTEATRHICRSFPPASVEVRTSEPLRTETFDGEWLNDRPCLHFNLHGLPDGGGWKGTGSPDWKLRPALDPTRLIAYQRGGAVVFAQCCYGARIDGRDASSSLALALLKSGARAFVGSLNVAYGVDGARQVALEESDLLAASFWRHVRQGLRLGEALVRAREEFDDVMTERLGGLDDDDQKTLLSFVLYGDPTLRLKAAS